MARLLKNPKQTAGTRIYQDKKGYNINVPKEGYYFSDDKAMDETVDYFKKELGFEEVKPEKPKKSKDTI